MSSSYGKRLELRFEDGRGAAGARASGIFFGQSILVLVSAFIDDDGFRIVLQSGNVNLGASWRLFFVKRKRG